MISIHGIIAFNEAHLFEFAQGLTEGKRIHLCLFLTCKQEFHWGQTPIPFQDSDNLI